MTQLDYGKRRPESSRAPLDAGPARSRKAYPSERAAQSAADYLNAYGKQRERWRWVVTRHELQAGKWELWRVPRSEAA